MTGNAADTFATRYDGWQVTAAGDQPCEQCGLHDDWPCAARQGPWNCTRAAEHSGQHVATSVRIVVAVWDSTPLPRAGSLDRRISRRWK